MCYFVTLLADGPCEFACKKCVLAQKRLKNTLEPTGDCANEIYMFTMGLCLLSEVTTLWRVNVSLCSINHFSCVCRDSD